jgi:hypothetical protein
MKRENPSPTKGSRGGKGSSKKMPARPQKPKFESILDRFRIINVSRYRETYCDGGSILQECGILHPDGTTEWFTVMEAETKFQLSKARSASTTSTKATLSAPSAEAESRISDSEKASSVSTSSSPHSKNEVKKPPKVEKKKVKVLPVKPDLSKRCLDRLGCTFEELHDESKHSLEHRSAGLHILSISQSGWCRICSFKEKEEIFQNPSVWRPFVLSTMDSQVGAVEEESSSFTKEE